MSGLPNVEIQMTNGMVKTILLDGVPVRGVRGISFRADASGAIPPTVTIELWASVVLSGEMPVTFHQDRYVQRCMRPHRDIEEAVADDAEIVASAGR